MRFSKVLPCIETHVALLGLFSMGSRTIKQINAHGAVLDSLSQDIDDSPLSDLALQAVKKLSP